jgi:hypothetical protein
MTTPSPPPPGQQPPQQQPDTGTEAAMVTTLAGLLLTAVSVAAILEALKLRFTIGRDLQRGLAAALGIVMSSPPPVTGVIGAASAQTSRMNLARRAQFVLSAGKRLAGDVRQARAQGKPVARALLDGLARERRYYGLHVAAMWQRATAAGRVDMEAAVHGDLLRWNTVLDSRTSPECRAMDGRLFRASRMPAIGFPGAVHPSCRCYATSPAEHRTYAAAA